SPVQMAADLPENYAGQPAFKFIRDVAVDWDTTRVLAGRIGDYVAVARKTKAKDEWFVGAITDEQTRTVDLSLSFLPNGRRYLAEIYADGPNANWRDNPESIAISSQPVTSATRLRVRLAAGGRHAPQMDSQRRHLRSQCPAVHAGRDLRRARPEAPPYGQPRRRHPVAHAGAADRQEESERPPRQLLLDFQLRGDQS